MFLVPPFLFRSYSLQIIPDLHAAGINIRKDMTRRKRVLYGQVKRLHRTLMKIRHDKDNFKRRLFKAERFAKIKGLEENLSTLNTFAAQFIKCQFREANKPVRQHRCKATKHQKYEVG